MFYLIEFAKTAPKEIRQTIDFGLEDSEIQRKFKDLIIKQSESVYDLIEVGDLVKVTDFEEQTTPRIIEINDSLPVKTHLNILEDFDRKIIGIYKKDIKDNYILVWERKD